MLPTKAFLAPMDEDEEIEVNLAKGNTVVIKYKALSELQPNGKRCGSAFFDSLTNCQRCWTSVLLRSCSEQFGRQRLSLTLTWH